MFLGHTLLKHNRSRHNHIIRTRARCPCPVQELRLHVTGSVTAGDTQGQWESTQTGCVAFCPYLFLVGTSYVVQRPAAAAGAEVVAEVDAVALESDDIGRLSRGIGDGGECSRV